MLVEPRRATVASIPEKLRVYVKPSQKAYPYNGNKLEASPAMVIDATGSTKGAENWLNQSLKVGPHKEIEASNDLVPYLTLINLDLRTEGGAAWKVITPEGWLVDLREDVFLELLFKQGIPKSGRLEGPFRWVKLGSQMRLVWTKSPIYQDVISLDKKKKEPRPGKIPPKDLVVGGVYTTEKPTSMLNIFLGWVRVNKAKKMAWMALYSDLCYIQDAYDRTWAMANLGKCRGGNFALNIVVTGSHSYTKKVTQITLQKLPPYVGYQSGYYDLIESEVEWLSQKDEGE